jgi:hypothetical protein
MSLQHRYNRLIMKVKQIVKPGSFPGSVQYWEKRYQKGGTSGSGSYNRLADFKAKVLNTFVKNHNIQSVIEFGCGDGNQLSLANYPSYIGLDVAPSAIAICDEKFNTDSSKSFFLYNSKAFIDNHQIFKVELSLSIDVIFHLVEDEIFENYMHHLFNAAEKFVIIYASNFNKNQMFHEKDRNFTSWVENNRKDWNLLDKIDNIYPYDPADPDNTSKADFFIFSKA